MATIWTLQALWTALFHSKGTHASEGVANASRDRPGRRSNDDLAFPGHREAGPR